MSKPKVPVIVEKIIIPTHTVVCTRNGKTISLQARDKFEADSIRANMQRHGWEVDDDANVPDVDQF